MRFGLYFCCGCSFFSSCFVCSHWKELNTEQHNGPSSAKHNTKLCSRVSGGTVSLSFTIHAWNIRGLKNSLICLPPPSPPRLHHWSGFKRWNQWDVRASLGFTISVEGTAPSHYLNSVFSHNVISCNSLHSSKKEKKFGKKKLQKKKRDRIQKHWGKITAKPI